MRKARPRGRQMIDQLESRVLLSATQVIRNGGFEGTVSTGDWATSGYFQADSRFTNSHSGSGYAYLANLDGTPGNSLSGTMYQQVALPANANSLTLSFWTKITTSETTSTAANDVMTVQVMDAGGTTVLQSLATYSNLDASAGYVQRTVFLARSLIGQSVRLVFAGSTDASLPTTFRVDDVSLTAVATATSNRVVGYIPEYRYSSFSKMDLTALTHANYFSISANSDGTLSTGGVNANHLDAAVAALHAAGVTVSITVGPQSFKTLSGNSTARSALAGNVVSYALAHNLDGVDIDWEPPAGNPYANYGVLIDTLYTAAHPQHLLITAAVNPWTNEIPVSSINAHIDWLNVMCYDFSYANHSTYDDAVSGMVDWTNYGVQKNKLLMGVPFYGRAGTSWSDTTPRTYSAILADYQGEYGVLPGPGVDSYLASDGRTYYFNGVNTIEKKAAYVRDNGYGGMMVWELGQDYWNAAGQYDEHSLLPVLKSMMNPPAWLTPLSGSQFDVAAGTLYLHAGVIGLTGDAGAGNPGLNVSVSGGATLAVVATQHLGGLTIAGGGAAVVLAGSGSTLVVTSLSVAAGAQLDLADNAMIVDYSGVSPAGAILPLLLSGRNGGTWNGSGIVSSTAAGDASRNTAIGYAEASALGRTAFAGQAVDSTALLLRHAYYGDTNLDGRVDADDFARADRGVARGLGGWINGDCDYSGSVTAADLTLLTRAFAAGGPAIPEPTPNAPASAPAGFNQASTAAAEPQVQLAGPARGRVRQALTFRLLMPCGGRGKALRVKHAIDWNGDGRIDQVVTARAGTTVRIRHAFGRAGIYMPRVYPLGSEKASPGAIFRITIA